MPEEICRHWRLVLGCALGCGLGVAALPFYTAGMFITPIQAEFGWTRAQLGAVNLVITAGLIVAMAPLAWLLERVEERKVASASLLAVGLAFAALSQISASFPLYLGLFAAMAVFGAGSSPVTFTRIVNRTFGNARGTALGLTLAGLGASALILPLFLAKLIELHGWRSGYLTLGAFAAIGAPIVYLCLPKGRDRSASEATAKASSQFRRALRSPEFWLLGLGFSLITAAVSGTIVHLTPLMQDREVSTAALSILLALIGGSVLIGRIAVGLLLDRMPALRLGCLLTFLAAVSTGMLLTGTMSGAYLAAAGVGLALGMEIDLASYVTADFFGVEEYGRTYGALYSMIIISSGLGPIAVGAVFDVYGSYTIPISISSLLLLLASLILFAAQRMTAKSAREKAAPV